MAKLISRDIAVVIPTLMEAELIAQTLDHVRQFEVGEIIVVDGGSTDGTREYLDQQRDVSTVVTAASGRGLQIAAGIAATVCPVVLVLHADTRLPDQAVEAIGEALSDPQVCAGCFRLRFDHRHWVLRISAWCTRFESRFTTFGDQAMFFRTAALDAAGGMPTFPLLEDVELRRRLKLRGRFIKCRASVTTSARRYWQNGYYATQVRNAVVLLAYLSGVSPRRLARIYRRPAAG